jgi:exonuclease SbcD
VTLVTVEDGRISEVAERPLDVLRWSVCRVDLSGCETVDNVHAAVRRALDRQRQLADGRILAVRLLLFGKCPVHNQLLEKTATLTEEFRGIAVGIGDVWLEKVLFQTGREVNLEQVFGEDTPIAGLLRSISRLALDDDTLFGLVPELAVLKSKLPPELHGGDDPFLDTSPNKITDVRTAVQELLIAKLLHHGAGQ